MEKVGLSIIKIPKNLKINVDVDFYSDFLDSFPSFPSTDGCFSSLLTKSARRSLKTKSVEGKSVLFMYIIMSGYVFGMTHKIVYNLDIVLVLYALNFLMVFFDLSLYYKHKKLVLRSD